MLATTIGIVVPVPSTVDRSTIEAGLHVGTVRQQEHVVVGQVVSGSLPI